MNAHGSSHLSQANDSTFHFFAMRSHQICQFINNDHDVGNFFNRLFGNFASFRVNIFKHFAAFRLSIERSNVLRTNFLQNFVATFHFANCPFECMQNFTIFHNHIRE